MILEDTTKTVQEAVEYLENQGYEATNFRANIRSSGSHPTYGNSISEALEEEVDVDTVVLGFDVRPEGMEHPDGITRLRYNVQEEAFSVQQALGTTYIASEEDAEGIKELIQTEDEQIASDIASSELERLDFTGVFEHDRITAKVERDLLDGGYDVVIGDGYDEDGNRLSEPVSEFP